MDDFIRIEAYKTRIAELEGALSEVLEWAEMVAGSSDFRNSETMQDAVKTLNGE